MERANRPYCLSRNAGYFTHLLLALRPRGIGMLITFRSTLFRIGISCDRNLSGLHHIFLKLAQ